MKKKFITLLLPLFFLMSCVSTSNIPQSFYDENIINKEYVAFIDIPARYQIEPSISDMGSELSQNDD